MTYDINFIGNRIVPDSHRKVKLVVTTMSGLALALCLLAVATMVISDLRMTEVYAGEVTRIQKRISALYQGSPSEQDLGHLVGSTAPQLEEIGGLVDKRLIISPIWERIAVAVPEGVWLTRVSIADPRAREEETRSRGKSNHAFSGIVIEGVALAGNGPEGDRAISQFLENLKSDTALASHVIDFSFVGNGLSTVGGVSVLGFEITCPF